MDVTSVQLIRARGVSRTGIVAAALACCALSASGCTHAHVPRSFSFFSPNTEQAAGKDAVRKASASSDDDRGGKVGKSQVRTASSEESAERQHAARRAEPLPPPQPFISRPDEPASSGTNPFASALAGPTPGAIGPDEFLAPQYRCGIRSDGPCSYRWQDAGPIPWDLLAQGEFIGPARLPQVPEYRLRADDVLEIVFRIRGEKLTRPYTLNVGDVVRIESLTSPIIEREVLIQPDGTLTARQLGQVPAAGRTIEELRSDLERRYRTFINEPSITVSPIKLNTTLDEFRAAIDSRAGTRGQGRQLKVTPEGTIRLPAIGTVPAQGLTLAELQREIEQRYAQHIAGLETTTILVQRAPHSVFVLGEVRTPGRFVMEGPTTLMQAIALAGGWNNGACLVDVVVFRRDENWQLTATRVNIRAPLYRRTPCPDDIWLRDSDIVVVPKNAIKVADDFIELVFTKGIYGVVPLHFSITAFKNLSSVGLLGQ